MKILTMALNVKQIMGILISNVITRGYFTFHMMFVFSSINLPFINNSRLLILCLELFNCILSWFPASRTDMSDHTFLSCLQALEFIVSFS